MQINEELPLKYKILKKMKDNENAIFIDRSSEKRFSLNGSKGKSTATADLFYPQDSQGQVQGRRASWLPQTQSFPKANNCVKKLLTWKRLKNLPPPLLKFQLWFCPSR